MQMFQRLGQKLAENLAFKALGYDYTKYLSQPDPKPNFPVSS
jgi:hypothetical protein